MKKQFIIITIFSLLNIISVGQTTFDTKAFGQKILDGKIKPTGDKNVFQVVDSLFCKNESNRNFYLKVANKIALKCDGALSEYVCRTAHKFYFDYTNYFIESSKIMDKETLNKWLNFIADDLYMDNHEGVKGLSKIK